MGFLFSFSVIVIIYLAIKIYEIWRDRGVEDNPTEKTRPKKLKPDNFAVWLDEQTTPVLKENVLPVVRLLNSTKDLGTNSWLQRKEYGEGYCTNEKVIMLVGATGAGKSTLINGIINYIFGVSWEETKRYVIVPDTNDTSQANSQTRIVTAYTVHQGYQSKLDYTLTIIDTPGFGDTGGIERDKEITQHIKQSFEAEDGTGIPHIDGVCFVVPASLPRLTNTQRYIYDQMLSLFGNDIRNNIFLMFTFGDTKKPAALSAIKEAGIPYVKHFKFNNATLFASNVHQVAGNDTDEEDNSEIDAAKIFWTSGMKNYDNFFNAIAQTKCCSLRLTRDVLNERSRIEVIIKGMQEDLSITLQDIANLDKIIQKSQEAFEKLESMRLLVQESTIKEVPLPNGENATNCIDCKRTCHRSCTIMTDEDKIDCDAVGKDGFCSVCKKRGQTCSWKKHRSMPIQFEVDFKTVERTSKALLEKFDISSRKLLSSQLSDRQSNILGNLDAIRNVLNRLHDIALRPITMTTSSYIDLLVAQEKSEGKEGSSQRVTQLYALKKRAEVLENIGTSFLGKLMGSFQDKSNNTGANQLL